jgi:hypothetical protein
VPKTIKVTRAQVIAAQTMVELAERGIGEVTPAVIAIANAKRPTVPADEPRADQVTQAG